MDAGQMIKPMLARGELRLIGATTLDEYRTSIEKDATLERRFQPVFVGEPWVEDTIARSRGLSELRGAPQGSESRHRARGGRRPVGPLRHGAFPARQGDRPHRRGGVEAPHRDRLHADRARPDLAAHPPLEIEKLALEKESDEASKERLERLEHELAELERAGPRLHGGPLAAGEELPRYDQPATAGTGASRRKREPARRDGDLAGATAIRYGELPDLERRIAEANEDLAKLQAGTRFLKEEVDPRTSPRWSAAGRASRCRASWRARSRRLGPARVDPPPTPRGRAGRGGLRRGECHPTSRAG